MSPRSKSGRTARAGRDGWAVTLVEYNQHTQMRILQRGMGQQRPDRLFRPKVQAVEHAPGNESPTGAVPQSSQQHRDDQVLVGPEGSKAIASH